MSRTLASDRCLTRCWLVAASMIWLGVGVAESATAAEADAADQSTPVQALTPANAARDKATVDKHDVELFEKHIRPVLVERCYECHNTPTRTEGGLAVDWIGGLLKGGDSGPAVVPNQPQASLLLRAIRHEDESLKMPRGGPKLPNAVVQQFERWIARGAVDPRQQAPTADDLATATRWETLFERRRAWWSFQPLRVVTPPASSDASWAANPVDQFLRVAQLAADVQPAPLADRATLLRRVTFVLTGLPPTVDELADFGRDEQPNAYERVVERLLASPRFGEQWARHWMDWYRYAETHGSEGDPAIPQAWRYRDYLIRALNADVSYRQLIVEHLAGDLLDQPRYDPETKLNESAVGPAHLRMVLHGYSATDALDEQTTFTDNQIDVLSKAVLGLTVSCARCHNHKFDAISQADFYALYGILASCRPAVVTIDEPARLHARDAQLTTLKGQIKRELAETWLAAIDELPAQLAQAPAATAPKPATGEPAPAKKKDELPPRADVATPVERWQRAIDEAAKNRLVSPLGAWIALRHEPADKFAASWQRLVEQYAERQAEDQRARTAATTKHWNLAGSDGETWFRYGAGLGGAGARGAVTSAGEFHVFADGPQVVANVYPAGVYTHLLSDKQNGVFTSPRFKIDSDELRFRVAGDGNARFRYVVYNYPRTSGPIHKSQFLARDDAPRWFTMPSKYWRGDWAHLEIATADDLPAEGKPSHGRSWFGVVEVLGLDAEGPKPQDLGAPLVALTSDSAPTNAVELAERYREVLGTAIRAWQSGAMSDQQAEFLGMFVRQQLLPNRLGQSPRLDALVAEYRQVEAEVLTPTRVPGVLETVGHDQALFVRGNHKQPAETVPRRFLSAFDGRSYATKLSGRRELAASLVAESTPITPRVAVNRLWHYTFGVGIVPTVDNFGHLGDEPSHPELLDWLARRFVDDGWSIKRMLRLLVTSRTFQLSHVATPSAQERDPTNQLLSHARVRRLEAESIRDALLAVVGRLDTRMYGPGDGGKEFRRSIYSPVRRNNPDPFLSAFDAPTTQSTEGRRSVTNVPAQSLTLLNDPFVIDRAQFWSDRLLAAARKLPAGEQEAPAARIRQMWVQALGRPPTEAETAALVEFAQALTADYQLPAEAMATDARIWRDVAQTIFNLKEFIFIR